MMDRNRDVNGQPQLPDCQSGVCVISPASAAVSQTGIGQTDHWQLQQQVQESSLVWPPSCAANGGLWKDACK